MKLRRMNGSRMLHPSREKRSDERGDEIRLEKRGDKIGDKR